MRADRLLAILMLLQGREQMTAQELADELEVSVRTIYRDMTALSAAGVPVYTERGTGGGCRLVEDYRTTLTGLTRQEIESLLMLTIPEPLASLEAGQKLKLALLKVFAAIPSYSEGSSQRKIYLDWAWWGQGKEPAPHLENLYQAVSAGRKVTIHYRLWNWVEIQRVVEPWGMVAKGGAWYLIYSGEPAGVDPDSREKARSLKVTELLDLQVSQETFSRPPDFNLERIWKNLCQEVDVAQAQYRVRMLVDAGWLPWVTRYLRAVGRCTLGEVKTPATEGLAQMEVFFESLEAARGQLLSLGNAVEILEPLPLRYSLADFAAQIVKLYPLHDVITTPPKT